jgi:hypothetical protein
MKLTVLSESEADEAALRIIAGGSWAGLSIGMEGCGVEAGASAQSSGTPGMAKAIALPQRC